MLRPPDTNQQSSNTSHQIRDINMSPLKRPRTSEDFLRFCDVVLSYANYPNAFHDEEEDGRKVESPLNSIGESARSNRSSTSTSDASVGEVDTADYDETWGMITCWCGKPFAGRPMIECESCLIWLHLSCARVRKSNIPKHFKCSRCKPPKGRRKRQSSGNSEPEPLNTSTPNPPPNSSGKDRNHMLHGHQLNHSHNNNHSSGAGGIHQLTHNTNHHQHMNLSSPSNGQKVDVRDAVYGVAGDNQSRQGRGYNAHNYVNGHISSPVVRMKLDPRKMPNQLTINYAKYNPDEVSNTGKLKKSPNKTPKRTIRPKQRKSQAEPTPISHIKHNSGSSSGSSGFSSATPLRLNLSTGPPNVTMGLPTPSPSPSSSTSSSSSHISINRGPSTLIPELSTS